MSKGGSDLTVRQHERHECDVACAVAVGEGSAQAVRLSRSASAVGGEVAAVMVDCSVGGMGLNADVFFPRGSELRVRLGSSALGSESVLVRVQRVRMLGREARYYLGTSFIDRESPSAGAFLDAARSQTAGSGGGSSAAGPSLGGGAAGA